MNRQNTTTTHSQAALIYENNGDINGAVDQAISHGYNYFYMTDRQLANNVWGGLPSYFASEVSYIANHP